MLNRTMRQMDRHLDNVVSRFRLYFENISRYLSLIVIAHAHM